MTEYSGRGDPRRSMELLWGVREVPTRGPKQGLTVEGIVAAAIQLADGEGLAAVSMRRVADDLGKSAMSLYTYVPGKAELLDLMLDTVLGELAAGGTRRRDGSLPDEQKERADQLSAPSAWRERVEASARRGWDFYQRHPWVLQISGARALLGPHEFDAYEAQLRVFDGLELSGVDVARIVAVVHGFVRGSAKAVSDARTAELETGLSDDDWWNARSPLLEELSRDTWDERYPTISRLAAEQAFDQRDDDMTPYTVQDALATFEFGLHRLLDGIETYIVARRGDGGSASSGVQAGSASRKSSAASTKP